VRVFRISDWHASVQLLSPKKNSVEVEK